MYQLTRFPLLFAVPICTLSSRPSIVRRCNCIGATRRIQTWIAATQSRPPTRIVIGTVHNDAVACMPHVCRVDFFLARPRSCFVYLRRYSDVLAINKTRVKITPLVPTDTDYINANRVEGFHKKCVDHSADIFRTEPLPSFPLLCLSAPVSLSIFLTAHAPHLHTYIRPTAPPATSLSHLSWPSPCLSVTLSLKALFHTLPHTFGKW